MRDFYKEQFDLMFTDVTLVMQVTVILLLLIDYFLIFYKVENYIKLSLPMLEIPEKFKRGNINQTLNMKSMISYGENPTYIYPKNIFSHIWSPIIMVKSDGENKVTGKVALTPLKLSFFLILFPFFYFVLESPWGDQFKNAFNSIFLLSFLSIGVIAGVLIGTWFTLDMLTYKKVNPLKKRPLAEARDFGVEVRKLKRRLFLGFILYLPLAVVITFPLIKMFPAAETFIGFTYFLSFVGWIGYHQFKLYFVKCIECGNSFFRKGMWHNTFSSKCLHCGLSIKKS